MASAISLMSFSLTLQPNLFQLFQPIGGVAARLRYRESDRGTGFSCAQRPEPHRESAATAVRIRFKDRFIFNQKG